MRSSTRATLVASVSLLGLASGARAELTTKQEALTIARNYVELVLVNWGDWGGSETPDVGAIQEFKRGERMLGYFCPIRPKGFLVLSLHKELAPIKAHSAWSNLDPLAEEGLSDLLKDCMGRVLNAVEQKLGRELRPDDQFGNLLEINYRSISEALAAADFDPQQYAQPRRGRAGAGMNYREGDVLLDSNWTQQPPYNHHCPDMGCDWWEYDYFNYNARVGCVATAGAQVMYHWRWPPFGEGEPLYEDPYDWPNMCDAYYYDGAGWFNNEHGVPVTVIQINAVANLCGEVAVAVDMDFGCGRSTAETDALEDAYEDYFRYDQDGWVTYRSDYVDGRDWFNALKGQFNINRPVPYKVQGHAIVGDGWKEEWADGRYYWYHMNYGWPKDGYDTWYALDELHLGTSDEYFIAAVVPDVAIGVPLEPYYPGGSGFWRYFDQDTRGINSTFCSGQWLQILKSGFLLVSGGGPTDALRIYGEPGLHTRFFLYGDPWGKTRILVQGGGIKIYSGAGMAIY
jgi:hypothetical protein